MGEDRSWDSSSTELGRISEGSKGGTQCSDEREEVQEDTRWKREEKNCVSSQLFHRLDSAVLIERRNG